MILARPASLARRPPPKPTMTKSRIALLTVTLLILAMPVTNGVPGIVPRATAATSITPLYPDLRALTPTDKMYISHPAGGPKLLSYTHIIYNAGPGPLELQPTYDPASDTADATQRLYGLDSSGNLVPALDVALAGKFFWHAPHNHYHFPAADFGLYAVASDGAVGPSVAMSPKLGFCVADSHEVDPTVARFSSIKAYSGGNCMDPTATVGLSPGWGDEYTPLDVGQSIDISTVADGVYWFESRVDPNGYFTESDRWNNNSLVKLRIQGDKLTVESPLPPSSPLGVERQWSTNGKGTITAGPVATTTSNTLLVALVTSDGPRSPTQSVTVSGGGLAWSRVRRANSQYGDAEVWQAIAPTPTTGATITSTPAIGGYDQSLVIETFHGAAGVGASAAASDPGGSTSVSVTTTAPGSLVFSAGMDWDHSIYRTPLTGEMVVHQWIDETAPNYTAGDSFWVQATAAPVPAANALVVMGDSAPVGDRWNAVAVEVIAAAPPPDTTPPVISAPAALAITPTGATIAWNTDEGATGRVDYGNTTTYGQSSTLDQNLTTAHSQALLGLNPATTYHFRVASTDASGNTAVSGDATFTTPGLPPGPLTITRKVVVQGHGSATTVQFSTSSPGELLVAFVASDGPQPGTQNVTVSGGGLIWSRAAKNTAQPGDTEIWTARAPTVASNITVTSTQTLCCYDQLLTVLSLKGAGGVGATGLGSGVSGLPFATVIPAQTGSWVFGVGLDWDQAAARTPAYLQLMQQQWVDPAASDTFWVQYIWPKTTAGASVKVRTSAPSAGRWTMAAVEVTAAP